MIKAPIIIGLGLLGLLPVWRSGLRENMSFYEFVLSHTILDSNEVEYIPEERLTIGGKRSINQRCE